MISNGPNTARKQSLDNAWDAWIKRVLTGDSNKRDVNHFAECGLPYAETHYLYMKTRHGDLDLTHLRYRARSPVLERLFLPACREWYDVLCAAVGTILTALHRESLNHRLKCSVGGFVTEYVHCACSFICKPSFSASRASVQTASSSHASLYVLHSSQSSARAFSVSSRPAARSTICGRSSAT